MKQILKKLKLLFHGVKMGYLKKVISKPDYNYYRAIMMGETYGAWDIDLVVAEVDKKICLKHKKMYKKKAAWYINKIQEQEHDKG